MVPGAKGRLTRSGLIAHVPLILGSGGRKLRLEILLLEQKEELAGGELLLRSGPELWPLVLT
jgi:hypothetical protein